MGTPAPAVAACLIVRDEQDRIAACLESVAPFVDEIVVCDTGSVDATASIARDLGARVISTDWSDDFAAARNAALSACSALWVLSLDADETVQGLPTALAPLLSAFEPEVHALTVRIDNATGPDVRGLVSHPEVKLFRREQCRWSGRVHEQLVGTGGTQGSPPPTLDLPADVLTLIHHGYGDPDVVRAKALRNARLCEQELEHALEAAASVRDIANAAFDLGRSHIACGRVDLAAPALHLCRGLADGLMWQWSTDFLIQLALADGRTTDAVGLIDQLVRTDAPTDYCLWLMARAALQAGDPGTALGLLGRITQLVDLSGNTLSMDMVEDARMTCGIAVRMSATAA